MPERLCDKIKNFDILDKTLEFKVKNEKTINFKEKFRKDIHFMEIALVTAQRSKDPCTQVGCVIVDNEQQVVSTGYNGFPIGIDDDSYRWDKENPKDNKHLYVVHAEMNAIINKRRHTLEGCTVYVTLFPCNECTKLLIQSKVKNIIYLEDRDSIAYEASKKMLNSVNIPFEKCCFPFSEINIEL